MCRVGTSCGVPLPRVPRSLPPLRLARAFPPVLLTLYWPMVAIAFFINLDVSLALAPLCSV